MAKVGRKCKHQGRRKKGKKKRRAMRRRRAKYGQRGRK